jgi:hypothetical protein
MMHLHRCGQVVSGRRVSGWVEGGGLLVGEMSGVLCAASFTGLVVARGLVCPWTTGTYAVGLRRL